MYNVYALYIYRFLNAQVTTYNTFKHNVDILTIRELCASFVLEWEMIFIVSNYQTINIVQVISCYMDVHGVKKNATEHDTLKEKVVLHLWHKTYQYCNFP